MSEATLAVPESSEQYHSDMTCVSTSQLKVLDESPSLYEAMFINQTYERPDSADLRLGRVVHAKLLQPDRFSELCPVMPDYENDEANCTKQTVTKTGKVSGGKRTHSKSTDYYQQKKAEFEAACKGKDVIDRETLALVLSIEQAIWRHEDARTILNARGENEVIHRWEDKCWRRAMMDAVRPHMERPIIADVKTMTGPPNELNFARSAAKWRWYFQPPMYLDAACDLYGMAEWRFLFICVNKQFPHEVAVHELKAEDFDKAEQRVEARVDELIRRRETGDWSAAWQREICSVPLPAWVWSSYYSIEEESNVND